MRCAAVLFLLAAVIICSATFALASTCPEPHQDGSSVKLVSQYGFDHRGVEVVWTGTEYGIAAYGQSASSVQFQLHFLSVNRRGDVVRGPVTVLSTDAIQNASFLWTGSEYAFAWDDFDVIHVARFDAQGVLLGETTLAGDGMSSSTPKIAWDGTHIAVVWEDRRSDPGISQVYFSLLDPDGQPIIPETSMIDDATESFYPAITTSDSGFALFWSDNSGDTYGNYFRRLNADGSPIGQRTLLTSGFLPAPPAVLHAGSGYAAAWVEEDSTSIAVFARLDSGGTLVGTPSTLFTGEAQDLGLAWTGTEYGLTWFQLEDGWKVNFARVAADGTLVGTPLLVADQISQKTASSLAWSGLGFAVLWADYPPFGFGNNLFFNPIACSCADTTDVDGDGFPACVDCDDSRSDIHPGVVEVCDGVDNDCDGPLDDEGAVAACGTGSCSAIVLACTDAVPVTCQPGLPGSETCDGLDNDCNGVVDDAAGCDTVCESPDFVGKPGAVYSATTNIQRTSLSAVPGGYGAAWEQLTGEIYFMPLDAAGSASGPPRRVTEAAERGSEHALVWNGSEFAMAWRHFFDPEGGISFARLDATGNRIGEVTRVTTSLGHAFAPTLVWNGNGYALAWEDDRDGNVEVYFARLDASGTKVGPDVRITSSPGYSYYPLLVWTGGWYGLTWSDDTEGTFNVYFARLDANGNQIGRVVRVSGGSLISYNTNILWTGSEIVLFWAEDNWPSSTPFMTRLDPTGARMAPDVALTSGTRYDYVWSALFTGGELGLTIDSWDEANNGEWWFVRLDLEGQILSRLAIPVTAGVVSLGNYVAWNQGDYSLSHIEGQESLGTPSSLFWQRIGCDCLDGDGDGASSCSDCNDGDPLIHPGAAEICNQVDDDCDGVVDDAVGLDADQDTVDDLCDNCPGRWNPLQEDGDLDQFGDACDVCPALYNPLQADADQDGHGDQCDICPSNIDPLQSDVDADGEGDACDANDGMLYLGFSDPSHPSWDAEAGLETFNLYRGDLRVLLGGGPYTQAPGANVLAMRWCGVAGVSVTDGPNPARDQAAFYLVTGNQGGVESGLDSDSLGRERPNDNPCP